MTLSVIKTLVLHMLIFYRFAHPFLAFFMFVPSSITGLLIPKYYLQKWAVGTTTSKVVLILFSIKVYDFQADNFHLLYFCFHDSNIFHLLLLV